MFFFFIYRRRNNIYLCFILKIKSKDYREIKIHLYNIIIFLIYKKLVWDVLRTIALLLLKKYIEWIDFREFLETGFIYLYI